MRTLIPSVYKVAAIDDKNNISKEYKYINIFNYKIKTEKSIRMSREEVNKKTTSYQGITAGCILIPTA